jgi:hypothetical protein
MNHNDYYMSLANRIAEFVMHNNSYSINSYLESQTYSRIYSFKEEKNLSFRNRLQHEENIRHFHSDFKDCLIWNSQFKIIGHPLPRPFVLELSTYVYDCHSRDPSYPPKPIYPNVEEFTKVIKCFEPFISSIDLLIHNAPKSLSGKNINSYLKEVLSLNNKDLLLKLHFDDFRETVADELSILTNRFSNEKDTEIKEGITNYLSLRESILEKNKDKNFELDIFEQIKVILHSDYWADILDYFPTLRQEKNKPIESKDVFSLNSNPVHYLDLDKEYILGISKTIITDRDFFAMVSIITEAINSHKPDTVEFINSVPINGQIKVFISGVDMNQDMAIKIGHLFESMINEYNSDNVIKTGNYSGNRDETIGKNQEYLNKLAEIYWLDIELTPASNTNIIKKSKI